MDNTLTRYLLWWKQSKEFDRDCSNEDATSEFGFPLKLPIEKANKGTLVRKMFRKAVKEVLVEDGLSGYYADNYRCWPPPLFLISITIVQLAVFAYYGVLLGSISSVGPVPVDSPLIYRPDLRIQVWRFFSYIFIHAGWFHLVFNVVVQLFVGLPLEMVHGSFRVGIIYFSGVLAGSLGTSLFDQDVYLVGASGGVYAVLMAHLANFLLNRTYMELAVLRVIGVLFVASCNVGVAIWDRYSDDPTPVPVSYVAHLLGALSGVCIGLVVLKNFDKNLSVRITWWIALAAYSACVILAVLWNIFILSPAVYFR